MVKKESADSAVPGRETATSLPVPYDLLQGLSQRRRNIIAPVFERPRNYVLLTIRALAVELGSDPATTLRIVRSMGFGGYRDFQRYLHELSLALTTPLERFQELTEKSGVAAQVENVIELDASNIELLRSRLDIESLVTLASEMEEADRLLVFGGDLAGVLVDYLAYHLAVLGKPCLVGTSSGGSEHLSHTTGPGDLVIAITFGQGLRQTVDALKVARENGAYCVGITDTTISPLTRYAHEFHLAPRSTVAIGESYVAPIALINALLAAFAAIDPERTRKRLGQATAGQKSGYRWYREE